MFMSINLVCCHFLFLFLSFFNGLLNVITLNYLLNLVI